MKFHLYSRALLCAFCISFSGVASLVPPKQSLGHLQRDIVKKTAVSAFGSGANANPLAASGGDVKHQLALLLRSNQKTILSFILITTYMAIVMSVMSLPICLSAIYADTGFYSFSMESNLLSKIVSAANLSNMAGKFILGRPTDYFGGDRTMRTTLLLSALALYGCSVSTNIHTFGAFWILFSFVFSAAWGAVGKIVRERFTKKEWALQLGLVYTGSRLGSMLSSLLYGDILRSSVSSPSTSGWRIVFRVSSGILAAVMGVSVLLNQLLSSPADTTPEQQIIGSRLNTVISKFAPAKSGNTDEVGLYSGVERALAPPSISPDKQTAILARGISRARMENVPDVLMRLSGDETFWLVLASRVSFVSVRQFATFLPFYLTTGHSMNPSSAAFASASFAFGSLVSSAFGTRIYQQLSELAQIEMISVCNFFGCVLPGLLCVHHSSSLLFKGFLLPQTAVITIISLWGVFWALPFGPAGALALSMGGVNHVALLINLFDAAGLLCASVLSYYALEYGKKGNWSPILLSLSVAGAVAMLSMSKAMSLQVEGTP